MNARGTMPALSLSGSQDRLRRESRLVHAYAVMDQVVRVLWPDETRWAGHPSAVRWRGAIVGLHEVEDHLYVSWRDEDHHETYAKVVELAWQAAGHEGTRVVHENADLEGLDLPAEEPVHG